MISFSIWHCDYCLGDICCCIKSNLPFLSSIVSTRELFSFFKVGGDKLKKTRQQGSTAQPLALRALQEHSDAPLWWFLPFARPLGWQIARFYSGEESFIAVRAFACTGCGPSLCHSGAANSSHSHGSTLLIVLVTPGHGKRLNSLQLGLRSC